MPKGVWNGLRAQTVNQILNQLSDCFQDYIALEGYFSPFQYHEAFAVLRSIKIVSDEGNKNILTIVYCDLSRKKSSKFVHV